METSSGDVWVFWILVPAFLAVGVHLFLYGRRRSAMVRRFARSHRLSHQARPSDDLADALTQTFRIEDEGVARAFSLVRDVVSDGRTRLFKCIEALDLNPWGEAANTHFNRVAVLFPVDPAHRHWATYERDGRRLEGGVPDRFADPAVARNLEAMLGDHPPPHPLSVTFARGEGLAYLQPMRLGSEKEDDLHYLLRLGGMLADQFGDADARDVAKKDGDS